MPRTIMKVIAGAGIGLALATPKADAADRFAMTCVENKTNITLNYRVKWGDGQWKPSSIGAGARTSHTWEYSTGQAGRSPSLYIRFDDDLSGRIKRREYVLESYKSPQKTDCQRYGREYHFRYDGSAKRFIDLVSIR